MDYLMRYAKPADTWSDALPLGNGRLGAMVYGHTRVDRVQLNEDSLWYGKAMDRNNPRLREALPRIQRHVFAGEIREAEDLIQRYMLGTPYSMRHYESLGELDIGVNTLSPFNAGWAPNSEGAQDYSQQLDLARGVHTMAWQQDGVRYHRTMFVSHPDQVLCIHYHSQKQGALQLSARLDRALIFEGMVPDARRPGKMIRAGGWGSMFLDTNHTLDARTLTAGGNAGGTLFAIALGMETDGTVTDPYTQLHVEQAGDVYLYLAASTDNRDTNPQEVALKRVNDARQKGFDALLKAHAADFEPLMRACTLELPDHGQEAPLPERVQRLRDGQNDAGLAALYFAYGRYLMAAGGREGSAALNLQGIWCKEFAPMWDSKYTTNINVQMNYWPAEVCNLSRTHESLFSLIETVCRRGCETARVMYGMRGSVCHHNTDYYGDCAPQDQYMASTGWTTGGAWLAMHLWEHFLFTQDLDFLRAWRPVMRDFAIFFVDFLVDDGEGHLVTCPSLSPENRYILPDGYDTPICAGPAMDNQILRDLFQACITADELLDQKDSWTAAFAHARALLPEDRVGSLGQLLEWREELPEKMPGMSHISHLYGSYPSAQMNWQKTPQLMEAARKTLELREQNNTDGGGWPLAWRACQYARLLDGAKVGEAVDRMITRSTDSFLNGRRVFQIDGNLGMTAGIAEALLQSHDGLIRLLPALPPQWPEGTAKGLVARGNTVVDLTWNSSQLRSVTLRPRADCTLRIVSPAPFTKAKEDGREIPVRMEQGALVLQAAAGKEYALCT